MRHRRVRRIAVGPRAVPGRRAARARGRHVRRHPASRARRRRVVVRRQASGSACGGSASSISPADTSRSTTKTARSGSCSTARSTTSASCARELEAAGHRFYTSTDTEVIVHAYEQWGSAAIGRLRGMFGLAIWDTRHAHAAARARPHRHQAAALRASRTAGCTSDRRSSRSCARRTCRASSISTRSITICPSSTRRATDRSSRASTSSRPATCSTWHDGRHHLERYWQLPADETVPGLRAGRRRRALRAVLADAVRSHLVSDVPLGAFLSGGIDSSVVVGLMAEAVGRAREDVLDRLRRAGVRRAGARAARRRALRHRSPRVRRQARCDRHPRRPGRALRRAVRRLVGDSDLVRVGDGAPACDGGPVRRRRGRAVRRLRPLPAASARRGLRSLRPAGAPPRRGRWRRRGCRTGCAARTSFGTSDATTQGRYLDAIRLFGADEKPALLSAATCGAS